MVTLDTIRKPVADDLAAFDEMVSRHFADDDSPMAEMLRYALSSRGKGIRPLVVLLSAAINSPSGRAGKRASLAAMLAEM
ncbi:MAG: polyprenyl synthetase family protein, partial [Alistipes sp.]|nr:polyprenyl synthetase family protein [Alistipes sp.]